MLLDSYKCKCLVLLGRNLIQIVLWIYSLLPSSTLKSVPETWSPLIGCWVGEWWEGLSLFTGGPDRSFSKCDPWASSIGIIWELVTSWALPQLYWVRNSGSGLAIYILTSLSDGCFWCMLKFETHCSKPPFPREICNHLPEWLWIEEQKYSDLWVLSHVNMSLRDPKPHCDPLVGMRVYGELRHEGSWSRSISHEAVRLTQWLFPLVVLVSQSCLTLLLCPPEFSR